jgi:hypothetical protein
MATAHGEKILKYLEENGTASSLKLAELWNEDHQKIVGTVKSLLCLGDVSVILNNIFIHYVVVRYLNSLPYVNRKL